MEVKFKPKFWKDINKIKSDHEVIARIGKIIKNVEKAKTIGEITDLKKLELYESRFRIKLYLDDKRSYRIGIYIHRHTVWFARFLHRRKIYDENW